MKAYLKPIFLSACLFLPMAFLHGEGALDEGFQSPPESAKPRTWWHWVSGNVSKEGITADLQAMKKIGLGGAQNFTVDQSNVHGPIKFMSPEWRALMHHALQEAGRLNLEVSIEGCDGWSESGGPWVTPAESMQKVVWTQKQVAGGRKIALDIPQPAMVRDYYADIAYMAIPLHKQGQGGIKLDHLDARTGINKRPVSIPFQNIPETAGEAVDPKSVIDLTGKKEWQAPAGDWIVLRIGHTSTGATTHPSTTPGLECDKLSTEAVTHHIKNMFGPVFADSPGSVGKTLKYVLLDSWECGCENWTSELPAEFQKRRGYSLAPWLPALTGAIIGSAEQTQRFHWDYRRTLADLLAENHYGLIQKFAHAHGMGLCSEASGIGMPTTADQLLCKKYCDIPMGEFWVNHPRDGNIDDPKEAASAAHIYGQKIAATESFTSTPNTAAWKNDPYSLKAMGDQEFCLGVNRFIFHRYAHQPWLDRVPGMSMGPWGINFERTNTWWEPGSAWISYLTRCEYLLQQGVFRADLCYFYGEGVPVCVSHASLSPAVPKGYDYDVCNADAILNLMEVKNGKITTPSGMSYRVLVLPAGDRMTLPVLRKVAKLVHDGAVVYGPRPLHSPSLTGYPASEEQLAKLAGEVWGSCDGKGVTEHAYGAGKVVWGEPLEKALAAPADFTTGPGDFLFIHRKDAGAEIYFVSNQEKKAMTTYCSFRVSERIPELWHADTGLRETIALYTCKDGVTTLPIHFDPVGSVFVVFRKEAPATPPLSSIALHVSDATAIGGEEVIGTVKLSDGKVSFTAFQSGPYTCTTGKGKTVTETIAELPAPLELTGSWNLTFPPKRGAPATATFDKLISWSESPVEGIKYFSGTATYTKSFELPATYFGGKKQLFLDLGDVKNLAEVGLNGTPLGILWKAPFRAEITGAAKPGRNELTVKLTNLWPNRLIGDQKLPEKDRITWASVSLYKANDPLLPSGLLGPVKVIPAQRVTINP